MYQPPEPQPSELRSLCGLNQASGRGFGRNRDRRLSRRPPSSLLLEAAVAEHTLSVWHPLAAGFTEAALRDEFTPECNEARVAQHPLAMADGLTAALAAARGTSRLLGSAQVHWRRLLTRAPAGGSGAEGARVSLLLRQGGAGIAVGPVAVQHWLAAALAHGRWLWSGRALATAMGVCHASVFGSERRRNPIDARRPVGKDRGDSLGNWCDQLRPGRDHLRQLARKRGENAAYALARLVEILGAEDPGLEETQHVRIHLRPDRLHYIERERCATSNVGMNDADSWVEPDGEARDPRLRFEQRVREVQECVRRTDR